MSKRLQHRHYGIFAVNPNDPSDFYGFCDDGISMGWARDHVRSWKAYTKAQNEKLLSYCVYQQFQRQFDWNWAKNYPKRIPHGYVLKAYRLNSKYCPYVVDFGYMDDVNYRICKSTDRTYDKWMYRNPKCKLGPGAFGSDDWKTWINEPVDKCDVELDPLKTVDMFKTYTRDLGIFMNKKMKKENAKRL